MVRTQLSLLRAYVQSLVGELRYHKPLSTAKKKERNTMKQETIENHPTGKPARVDQKLTADNLNCP